MSGLLRCCEDFFTAHRKQLLPAGLCSGAFTALFLLIGMQAWNPLAVALFWGIAFLCSIAGFSRRVGKKEGILCGLFCLSVCFCLQGQLTLSGLLQFNLTFAILLLLFAATAFPACLGLCRLLAAAQIPFCPAPACSTKKRLLFYTVIILICWTPMFLCWGPIRLDVDSVQLLEQAFHGGLNDAHPIAYTLLLRLVIGPFYHLGVTELGAYLFGALQMTAVAAALAYSLVWMRQRGSGRLPVFAGFALFCGTTAYTFQSMVAWKDPLFNAVLLLYTLFLFDTACCRGKNLQQKKGILHFVVLTLLLCFLRGNGWLIAVVVCCCLAAFAPCRKTLVRVFLPLLVAIKLITGPGYAILGIQSTLGAESWAMPLQQLGYVAANAPQDFSPQQQETLSHVISVEALGQTYSSVTVDPIKTSSEFNAEYFKTTQGKLDLLSVWIQMMPSHLGDYAKAWLMETAMYTNPRFDAGTYSFPYEGSNGSFGISSKDIVSYFTGWQGLRSELESRATFIPPAILAFGLVLCGIVLVLRRQAHRLIAYLPMYLVWVGLLLGSPSYAQFRYVLVFAFALPSALFMLFAPPQEQKY